MDPTLALIQVVIIVIQILAQHANQNAKIVAIKEMAKKRVVVMFVVEPLRHAVLMDKRVKMINAVQ